MLFPAPARYAFTVVANITVYGAAWLLLHLQGSPSMEVARDVTDQLGVQDVQVFQVSGARVGHPCGPEPGLGLRALPLTPLLPGLQNLSLLVIGVGAVFSLLFHLGTREGRRAPVEEPDEHSPLLAPVTARPLLLWKHWLREPAFYQVGCCRWGAGWNGAGLPAPRPPGPFSMGLWAGMADTGADSPFAVLPPSPLSAPPASQAVTTSGSGAGLTRAFGFLPTGGLAVHEHEAHREPLPDLHSHVSHLLSQPAQGELGGGAGPGPTGPLPPRAHARCAPTEVHRHHPAGDVPQWFLLLLPHEARQQVHREERKRAARAGGWGTPQPRAPGTADRGVSPVLPCAWLLALWDSVLPRAVVAVARTAGSLASATKERNVSPCLILMDLRRAAGRPVSSGSCVKAACA